MVLETTTEAAKEVLSSHFPKSFTVKKLSWLIATSLNEAVLVWESLVQF